MEIIVIIIKAALQHVLMPQKTEAESDGGMGQGAQDSTAQAGTEAG